MFTSYFAVYRGPTELGVCIALMKPRWHKGPSYPDLFPTPEIFQRYRNSHDIESYAKAYRADVLDKLDAKKVYDDLKGKVVLCYETSDKFCHRHIIADWIEEKIGIHVSELTKEEANNYGG